jgi:hypothetical protein
MGSIIDTRLSVRVTWTSSLNCSFSRCSLTAADSRHPDRLRLRIGRVAQRPGRRPALGYGEALLERLASDLTQRFGRVLYPS